MNIGQHFIFNDGNNFGFLLNFRCIENRWNCVECGLMMLRKVRTSTGRSNASEGEEAGLDILGLFPETVMDCITHCRMRMSGYAANY